MDAEELKQILEESEGQKIEFNIDGAMNFLKRYIAVRYEMTGEARRREVPELPYDALRDAIINAVAHRDYFERGANVMVEVYDNRIEISNPGGLPRGLSPESFGKRSVLRNPKIAGMLHRADYIEKMGTGIRKMQRLMSEAGLAPLEFTFTSFFTVTFKKSVAASSENAGEMIGENFARNFGIKFGLRRVDETPVHEAIREALINTLIHADYTGRTPILIVKGPDMFLFRNPGSMRLPLEDALRGGLSDCRNRNLQKMFQLIGYGEQAGSGIPRIYRNWSKQLWRSPDFFENLDPEYTQLTMHMVSLLPQETLSELEKRFGLSFRRLSELQQLALATAAIERTVTNSRLKSMTSAHPHDITRALQILVKNRFLDSSGATRGTYYYLVGSSFGIKPLDFWSDKSISGSEHLVPDSEHLKLSSEHLDERDDISLAIRGKKKVPKDTMDKVILSLCKGRFLSLRQLAELLNRSPDTLRVHYLNRLVKEGTLEQRYPDKPNHPDQGYCSKFKD
ncbi:MAG: hypothetical protein M0Q43_04375 [Methanothrix sp.]|jgi:predicted HTH transcriptional regulator|nr:hypothetical protein [Methanothrix sp.]